MGQKIPPLIGVDMWIDKTESDRPTPPKPPLKPQSKHVEKRSDVSDDNFLISAAIGYVTDSAIVGGLVGGNFAGGTIGDLMNNGDL